MSVWRKRARISALVGAVSLASSAAMADRPQYNWTGFSIYAGGGGALFRGDANVSDTTTYGAAIECTTVPNVGSASWIPCLDLGPVAATETNALSSKMRGEGAFGTIGIGADFEPVRGLVVGAFADADFYTGGSGFSGAGSSTVFSGHLLSVSTSTSVTGKLNYDYSTTIGGRVGVLSLDRKALMYVLAGWTRLEADGTAQIDNAINVGLGPHSTAFNADPISTRLPGTYDGLTVGVGTEVKFDQSWSLKLEGRYTHLGARSASYAGETSNRTLLGYTEYGPSCGSIWPANGSDCAAYLHTTASSRGSVEISPEIWSARAVLSYKFY